MVAPSTHSSACERALAHARRGQPVFPGCWPDAEGHCACPGKWDPELRRRVPHEGRDIGKAPLTSHGVLDATTDEAQIIEWWTRWPDANVLLDLKGAELVMIDPDSSAAEQDVRQRGMPATTIRHSRNRAYLCKRTAGCPTISATRLGESGALDIKADGYAVSYGRHREGQEVYTEDFEPAEVPTWVVELLQRVERTRTDKQAVTFTPDPEAAAKGQALYSTIRRRLPERIQKTIEEGPSAYRAAPEQDGIVRIRPPDMSRSGADGSVVYYLVRLGLSDDDIRNIYAGLSIGELGKYADRGAKYLETTIANQRAWLKNTTIDLGEALRSANGNGHQADVPPPNRQERPADQSPPRFGRTDVDNGRRLVARFGDSIRFCWPWDCWLHWDSTRWLRDTTGTIYRLAKEVRPLILLEAAQATDDKEQEALAKWALTSASERAIRAMVALARSELGVPVTPPELDADPWKLTVPNGTLNLKTGELGSHRREDLITRMAGAAYDPSAECPRFLAFLDRIMDSDAALIAFLKRAIGSSLTGDTSDRALFIAWGSGGNGKTTLFDVLRHLLGEYALRTPTETLLAKRDGMVPNDVARLKGARFVYASEAEEGRRLAESFVKDLTGGDPISARFMRSEWFDFTPECKVWLATNHRPVIRGSDNAIWDRLKLIPFTVTIPPEERVPRRMLMAELTAELPGILRWAVEGCLEWQRDGLGDPPAVQQATREYRAAMDVVGAFITDCCILRPDVQVTTKAIYTAYVSWCESNHEKPLSKNMFTARLAERDLRPTRIGSRQDRGWAGVGLATTAEPDTTPDTDTTKPKNQVNADVVEPREVNPEKASGVSGVSGSVQRYYPCPGCDELIPVDGPCPTCDARVETD